MKTIRKNLRALLRYPSAIAGLAMILFLVGLSIYTLVKIPYQEAIRLWRGGEDVWYMNPKNAPPAWTNLFRKDKLPSTIFLSTKEDPGFKVTGDESQGVRSVTMSFPFDYSFDAFPQEMAIYFDAKYASKSPFVSISWLTPDGRTIQVGNFNIDQPATTYRFSQDARLQKKLKGLTPEQALFMKTPAETGAPVKGAYTLKIEGATFEHGDDLDAEFVLYGLVHGIAGTDHLRRDLSVALLWGTPVALAFGLLAALGTTVLTLIIAATGAWFGGWVDELIQRITEVNLVLPMLPILIMIGTLYSRSIWLILGATILLSIFGSGIKTFRAIFLQVKESPCIEAAQTYGCSNLRIIFLYIIPPIIPMLIPQLVTLIPTYVFTEASLAVLGLGDPVLPTWGKVINDAHAALYQGYYYWILEPAAMLMLTSLAFAMLGFSLDRIFNPKLRGV